MKRQIIARLGLAVLVVLMAAPLALAEDATLVSELGVTVTQQEAMEPVSGTDKVDYMGQIRLYIVEPVSRWKDSDSKSYEYGFLDFGIEEGFVLPEGEQMMWTFTFDPDNHGLGYLQFHNIAVQAVVSDWDNPQTAYADPPSGNAFTAYYHDAAAMAFPGQPGINSTEFGTTHTMFAEECTSGG